MLTAGLIANKLGIDDVFINYRLADLSKNDANKNPLKELEFVKSNGSFFRLKKSNKIYKLAKYFPHGLNFKESIHKLSKCKEEIINGFPESN